MSRRLLHTHTVSRRQGAQESSFVLLGLLGDAVHQRELDLVGQELLDVRTQALGRGQNGGSNDIDVQELGVVTGSHVHVHLVNSSAQSDITELLGNVHDSGVAPEAQQDGVVLHGGGVLLEDALHLEHL